MPRDFGCVGGTKCRSWWRGGGKTGWDPLSVKSSSENGGIKPQALQLGFHFSEEAYSRGISRILECCQGVLE